MIGLRQKRLQVLEALAVRAKQFRSREDLWPFRVPHEPLALDAIVEDALEGGWLEADALRSRTVLRMEWRPSGPERGHTWEAWVIALPSGISLYCDTDPDETRVLGSVKRGSAIEADRFFLELLAESRGRCFEIEMSGAAPDRVRSSVGDREFLVDMFVELFEGTAAERSIRGGGGGHATEPGGRDFRAEVERWLTHTLVASPHAASRAARPRPRLREVRERR